MWYEALSLIPLFCLGFLGPKSTEYPLYSALLGNVLTQMRHSAQRDAKNAPLGSKPRPRQATTTQNLMWGCLGWGTRKSTFNLAENYRSAWAGSAVDWYDVSFAGLEIVVIFLPSLFVRESQLTTGKFELDC